MTSLSEYLNDSFPTPGWASCVDEWQFDSVAGSAYRCVESAHEAVTCHVQGWEPLNAHAYVQWFQGTTDDGADVSVELLLCDDDGKPERSANLTASAARQLAAALMNAADLLDGIKADQH